MEKPLLSVVIPFYNSAPYLEDCIKSLTDQCYSPVELIFIDDGSTDGGEAIFRKYPNIKYIRQNNLGPGAARNNGIKESSGELIGFHDADDICVKYRFREQVLELKDNPDLFINYSKIKNFIDKRYCVPSYLTTPKLMEERVGFISSAVMRKDVFKIVGYFREDIRIGEDIDWITRANKKKIISSITYTSIISPSLISL